MYDIETLSINIVLNKEHFCGKIMQEMCTKSWSQAPFLFLVKKPKKAVACKRFF